jgi:hypothetical protein
MIDTGLSHLYCHSHQVVRQSFTNNSVFQFYPGRLKKSENLNSLSNILSAPYVKGITQYLVAAVSSSVT